MNKILRKLRLADIFSSPAQINSPILDTTQSTSFPSYVSTPNNTTNDYSHSSTRSLGNKIKKFSKNSPYIPLIIVILIVVLVAYFAINKLTKSQTGTVAGTNDQRIDIQKAKATEQVNREFLFPLKDANGKVVSKLKYTIQSAELRDEIIIKGQKATAVQGRTFLILNLKITNDYNKSVQINARDYIRLISNNSSEKLAPDIHNDPVEVQAISTKLTRVGFPISDTDINLALQVGEIDGKKDLIKLNLK
jgi:hypothetical protein